METVADNKCPSCGANIKFNAEKQKWVCEYCGESYDISVFQDTQKKEGNLSKQDIEMDEYNCPNCGAIVITDENTVATHCVYCGSVSIMKNRLHGEFQPDKIIPFKNTKESAIKAFSNYTKGKWFAPSDFKNVENIKKLSGVYIPFWLYDSKVSGRIVASAEIVRRWSRGDTHYTETSRYNCTRAGSLEVTDVPVDGSTKFPDDVMDSIEPYDYSEFKDFNRAYLAGFLAEKYDLTSDQVYDRAKNRIENTCVDALRSKIQGFSNVHITSKQININKRRC